MRAVSDAPGLYTFWDYQAGAWQKNNGIRIDHLLLSPQAADRLIGAGIDKHVRAWEKPSDHVPVYVDLDIEAPEGWPSCARSRLSRGLVFDVLIDGPADGAAGAAAARLCRIVSTCGARNSPRLGGDAG